MSVRSWTSNKKILKEETKMANSFKTALLYVSLRSENMAISYQFLGFYQCNKLCQMYYDQIKENNI